MNFVTKQQDQEERRERLFKLVFNNIVLFREIYQHIRLYKKNERVVFNDRGQLLGYKERDYIKKIVYSDIEMLVVGDLPVDGVLKEIRFSKKELSLIKGDAIPYGVEILEYRIGNFLTTAPLSTLPSTIHTVNNALIPLASNDENYFFIPPNITSISLRDCPNISSNNDNSNGFIAIPNTIRTLKFNSYHWSNEDIKLRKGDIPEGVTSLEIKGYESIISTLSKDILPNSITDLRISYYQDDYDIGSFDFIPLNVESLHINCHSDITEESNLKSSSSIKKLVIDCNDYKIFPNSLPSSVTHLEIDSIKYQIKKSTIPNGVLSLELDFSLNEESFPKYLFKDAIPNSVTSLLLNGCSFSKLQEGSLPNSIRKLKTGWIRGEVNIGLDLVPSSVVDLSLYGVSNDFKFSSIPKSVNSLNLNFIDNDSYSGDNSNESFPNNVTSLRLNIIINQVNILPSSLTSLELYHLPYYDDDGDDLKELTKMVSILPSSLSSITLPREFKENDFNFPSTINEIKFK